MAVVLKLLINFIQVVPKCLNLVMAYMNKKKYANASWSAQYGLEISFKVTQNSLQQLYFDGSL